MKIEHVSLRRGAAPATRSVGERTPLVDGIDKVTGRARYTADLPLGPALVGKILRSSVAHGIIHAIDTEKARAIPGVRATETGAIDLKSFRPKFGAVEQAVALRDPDLLLDGLLDLVPEYRPEGLTRREKQPHGGNVRRLA